MELFRGTIGVASVYPREVVKEALRVNAAALIFSQNHPSGNPEPSQADKVQGGPGAGEGAHAGSHHRGRRGDRFIRRAGIALTAGGFGPFLLRRPIRAPRHLLSLSLRGAIVYLTEAAINHKLLGGAARLYLAAPDPTW